MKIARTLYPVQALGPGKRIAIWVQGCTRRCPGCANPELWDLDGVDDMPLDYVVAMVRSALRSYQLNGLTLTGGEPFLQAIEIVQLIDAVSDLCDDILVFSGYTYNELLNSNDPAVSAMLNAISVIVDGPYQREMNLSEKLRGSSNQNIIILSSKSKEKYEKYLSSGEKIFENFVASNGVISVGIHPPDFDVPQ